MENIDIYCQNCKEHILQANLFTLTEPLKGSMFTVKDGMEWDIFHGSTEGYDLSCPMCSWCFHFEGQVLVKIDGEFKLLRPDDVIEEIGGNVPRGTLEGGVAKTETHLPLEQTLTGSSPVTASTGRRKIPLNSKQDKLRLALKNQRKGNKKLQAMGLE